MNPPIVTTTTDSFSYILNQTLMEVSVYLPRIIAALIILLIGTAIAKAFKRVMVKVLETFRVSTLIKNTPVEDFLKNSDTTSRLEEVLGSVLYWLTMLIVVHTAVAVLGLAPVSTVLDKLLAYIPHIFSAVLVLFFGVLLAGVVESLVKGAIKSIDGKASRLLGKVSSYLVITLAILAAVSELGIASEFIMILFIGFVTTVSLGLGLALGLGGKDLVSEVLTRWYHQVKEEVSES